MAAVVAGYTLGMEENRIDWSTAEVRDRTLRVELAEKAPKEFRERLSEVLKRLGRDGDVKLGKQRIEVSGVAPGAEGDVRHLLESALLQVNADFTPDEDEGADDGDARSPEDREMTEAFRAFAEEGQDTATTA